MINNSPKDTIDQIMQNDKGVIKKIDVVEREGLIGFDICQICIRLNFQIFSMTQL